MRTILEMNIRLDPDGENLEKILEFFADIDNSLIDCWCSNEALISLIDDPSTRLWKLPKQEFDVDLIFEDGVMKAVWRNKCLGTVNNNLYSIVEEAIDCTDVVDASVLIDGGSYAYVNPLGMLIRDRTEFRSILVLRCYDDGDDEEDEYEQI